MSDQPLLFAEEEVPEAWRSEWVGMPEFVMGNTEPVQKITVSFETREDVEEFASRLGVRVTGRTDSIWFPERRGYVSPSTFKWVSSDEQN